MESDILIFGTGSLAKSICYELARNAKQSLNIVVLGRNNVISQEISIIANALAIINKSSAQFRSDVVKWEDDYLLEILDKYKPKTILLAASLQSAWEFSRDNNAWANLVKKTSYAITLPFQAKLAIQLAHMIKKNKINCHFVNACYPDVVNPLLKSLKLDVLCGIGNIGILYAGLQFRSILNPSAKLKILAHHYHLGQKIHSEMNEQDKMKIWCDDVEINNIDLNNIPLCSVKSSELNQITGLLGAELLLALFENNPCSCHVPGPMGLPGGYPIMVSRAGINMDLPHTVTLSDAIALNKYWSSLEGVTVTDKAYVMYSDEISQRLQDNNILYSSGFYGHEIESVCQQLLEKREELRGKRYE